MARFPGLVPAQDDEGTGQPGGQPPQATMQPAGTEPPRTNMFDDIDPAMAAAPRDKPNMFDDLPDPGEPAPTGGISSFISHAIRGVLPTAGGMAGAGAGAEVGAAAGAFGGPLVAAAGGFIGGVAGFMAGSSAAEGAQEWGLHQMPDSWTEAIGQSDRQARLQEQQHPVASFLGGLAPYAVTMTPGAFSTKALNLPENATTFQRIMANPVTSRIFGGVAMGGMELGQEEAEGEKPDWTRIGISTGFGLIFNKPTRFGEYLTGAGADAVSPLVRPLRGAAVGAYMLRSPMEIPPEGVLNPLEPTVAQAGDLGVIGPGITESTFQGSERQSDATRATAQNAAADEAAALGPVIPPDMDATARRLDPETFQERDTLLAQRDALKGFIDRESNPPPEALDELAQRRYLTEEALRNANPNSPDARNYRAQLAAFDEEQADIERRQQEWQSGTHVDTPAVAQARQHLMETEHALWDTGPAIAAARRRAADYAGEPVEAEAQAPPTEALVGRAGPVGSGEPPKGGLVRAFIDHKGAIHYGRPGESAADLQIRVGEERPDLRPVVDQSGNAYFGKLGGEKFQTPEVGYAGPDGRFINEGEKRAIDRGETPPPATAGVQPPVVPAESAVPSGTGVPRVNIAQDVTDRLVSIGRDPDTARAEGALQQAYYDRLAARFKGAIGTPEQLYQERAAKLVSPTHVAREPFGEGAPQTHAEHAADLIRGGRNNAYISRQVGNYMTPAEVEQLRRSMAPAPEAQAPPTAAQAAAQTEAAPAAAPTAAAPAEAAAPPAPERRGLRDLGTIMREEGVGEKKAQAIWEQEAVAYAKKQAAERAAAKAAGTQAPAAPPAAPAPLAITPEHPALPLPSQPPLSKGGEIARIPASEINVDPERFQFKGGTGESGVSSRLEDVEEWDPKQANVVLVWQDNAGKYWITDGHQRLGLAKRLEAAGQPPITMNAFVDKESDGITAQQARVIAAATNIGQETGTAIDAAKVLREAEAAGIKVPPMPPKGVLVRLGKSLAKLSPDAFGMAVNEVVPTEQAAMVGRLVTDPLQQVEAMRVLAKAKPDPTKPREAEFIIRDVMETSAERTEQGGLFGAEHYAQSATLERAKVYDETVRQLSRDRTTFRTLVNESERISGEGRNVLDIAANKTRLSADEEAKQLLTQLATRKGPVSDALTGIAKRVRDKELSAADGAREFLGVVRGRLSEGLGEGADAGGAVAGTERELIQATTEEGRVEDQNAQELFQRLTKPPQSGAPLFGEPEREQPLRTGPEPTIRGDTRQVDMFGTADAAVQAQAARDQAGRGALAPNGPQAKADEGLFAPKAEPGRTLFQRRSWEEMLAFGRQVEALAQTYADADKPAAFLDRQGFKYLVSHDLNYPPDGWRVTMFGQDGQPSGHWEAKNAYDAFREVLAKEPEPIGANHPEHPEDENQQTLFQRKDEEGRVPLESGVARAVDRLPQAKGTGEQMLAAIKRTAGVKPEELKWMGLEDWLQGQKTITKAEIADYVAANSLDVREVRRSDEGELPPHLDEHPVRYGQYQLPGGQHYHEMLITLPHAQDARLRALDDKLQAGGALTEAERTERVGMERQAYRSPHWEEPNVLGHVRFSERTAPDGAKVLHIEELQSDLAQSMRRERANIEAAVDRDFHGIVKRMQNAGILKVDCT